MSRLKNKFAVACVVLLLASMIAAAGSVYAAGADDDINVDTPMIPIFADGIMIAEGICIDGSTYVSLRLFSEMLAEDAEVNWDQDKETASVTGRGLEITAKVGDQYFYANGRYFYASEEVINLDSTVMVPIRELAKVFSLGIEWHDDWSVSFSTDVVTLMKGGENYYDEDDIFWLSRIINAESGNQPLDGKIGTGNVVLNRVQDPDCPDNIYDVIFDRKHGVQFSPVETGTVHDEPNEESIIAAKLCIEGYSTVGHSLFFVNPEIGITAWMNQTRTFVISIGDHDFYA